MQSRIDRLLQTSSDLFFIEHPIDLFYLTGMNVSRGILCLSPKGVRFFLDQRYFDRYKHNKEIKIELSTKENIERFLKLSDAKRFLINPDTTTMSRFEELQKGFLAGKGIGFNQAVKYLRMIKDEKEIEQCRKSAHLTRQGMEFARKMLRDGVEEKKVAFEIEKYCREMGAEKMAFDVTVAFGENTAFPHYTPGNRKLKKGDPVLIDMGVFLGGYASDMTRSFLFDGDNLEYERVYAVVKKAQETALSYCKEGIPADLLLKSVEEVFEKSGMEKKLKHGLGHSVGLEIHEYPRLPPLSGEKFLLQSEMVVAIEPGLYLEGKFGIRLEDTFVIRKDGYEGL